MDSMVARTRRALNLSEERKRNPCQYPLNSSISAMRLTIFGFMDTSNAVDGSVEIAVDVCVIATSKRELKKAVAGVQFREDLFYHLRGLEINLPTLKEHGEDLLLLAEPSRHYLPEQNRTFREKIVP